MRGWLRNPKNRHIVSVIGIGIVVSVGVLSAAFLHFGGKSWLLKFVKREMTMVVCQGEHRQGCTGSPHFINCETNLVGWVKSIRPDICVKVLTKELSAKSGDRCGYTTFEVQCSSK
jgi:hypothetical protein